MGVIVVSVLWHEMGHAVAFKAFGHDAEISLAGILGLTFSSAARELTKGQMLVVASAGPGAGLLLAGLAQIVRDSMFAGYYRHPLDLVVMINVVFSLFNLLPAYPLDGGRIVKSIMEMLSPAHGEKVANVVSLVVAGMALMYALHRGMELTALMLLGVAGINFTGLRTRASRHEV